MAKLFKHLKSWLGKKFKDDNELRNTGIDFAELVGSAGQVTIKHSKSNDTTYANVEALAGVTKGMKVRELQGEATFFTLQSFDPELYSTLPAWIQKIIAASPEYQGIQAAMND